MKADLHIHTNFSYDGLPTPEEVVNFSILKGIDCIAICDHGQIEGSILAQNFAQGKKILVIPGIEVRSQEGDILGLGIQKKIPNNLSAKETIEEIIRQGGMAVIPHPFDYFSWFREIEKYINFFQEKKVAIEVHNASLFFNFCNLEAQKFAERHDLPFIAGSDAHSLDFIGKAYLEIEKKTSSVNEILEEIKKKNVKIGFEETTCRERFADHLKRTVAKSRKRNITKRRYKERRFTPKPR